ncbi:CopY/TcrY family copper transport repressor [Marinilactibacillus kalidii]|uniref:CopY/TcrY family copper transport repressor n=1 Tax=Marinilactibacillus kalidii TaxID=2820274 RepID=UPI001ABE95EB|nr:CopY/TcrY family copper transport repressor [Marinilactibacillus kalidii]
MQENQMTPSEREVMKVVWANPQTTSKYISQVLEEKKAWKPATTKTLIGRLVKKYYLTTIEEGRKYRYEAMVSEQENLQDTSNALLNQVCTKKRGKVLYQMIDNTTLSIEDIEQLEQLLKNKKPLAPKVLACECTPGQCDCHTEGESHCGNENISH